MLRRDCVVLFHVFSGYSFNVKWTNLDPLDVVQLLGNFGPNVQKELENLLKRVCDRELITS